MSRVRWWTKTSSFYLFSDVNKFMLLDIKASKLEVFVRTKGVTNNFNFEGSQSSIKATKSMS